MVDTTVCDAELNKFDQRLNTFPFEPRLYISRGMLYFRLGRLVDSLKDFNKAEALNPQLTPYLWQRGLTYYYLEKYAKAARQFELYLSIHSQDIENTLWFFLCIAQLEDIVSARDCLLPVRDDVRPYMKQIYQVFAGQYDVEILSKLNGNCANVVYAWHGSEVLRASADTYHNFYTNFYGGLYYEAQRDKENSASLISKAISYKIDNYMWYVACIHQSLRCLKG